LRFNAEIVIESLSQKLGVGPQLPALELNIWARVIAHDVVIARNINPSARR
jgi:hypothetical protein